jgi:dTDP-4-dehydrorhamnose 3,5-epimerase-like enzyme
MKNIEKYSVSTFGNIENGYLSVIESMKDIPFEIKRIYYIHNVSCDVTRGGHAHTNIEQVLICINGKVKLRLFDGYTEQVVELDNPMNGVYISSNVWREMYNFSDDAVLLVLTSTYYNETDTIRDYDAFLSYINKIKD